MVYGRLRQRTLHAGAQGGRLQSIKSGTTALPTAFQWLEFWYNSLGSLAWTKDKKMGSPLQVTYDYDLQDRLSSANATGGPADTLFAESYTYDANGRLATKGPLTLSYAAQSAACPNGALQKPHTATSAGANAYCYNSLGLIVRRTVGGVAQSLGYNAENQLTSATGPGLNEQFTYDGDGQRVKQVDSTGGVTVILGDYYELSPAPPPPADPNDTLIGNSAYWLYWDNGTVPPGSAWQATAYDDTDWYSGDPIFGYGDGHERTEIDYGSDPNNKYVTTYFRKAFYVSDPALYSALDATLTYDDGAVVYLNGVEWFRVNMPAGAIDNATISSTAVEDTTLTQSLANPGSRLVAGKNVIAVEVHQGSRISTDLHFALSLVGVRNQAVARKAQPLVELGSLWKYQATGAAPAGEWRTAVYNDAAWASGAAILGYGDGHETTTVPYGPNPSSKYITTYLRQRFTLTDPSAYSSLDLWLEYDDGMVVYLNGVEVARANLPTGAISYTTLASQGLEDLTTWVRLTDLSMLQAGENVLAVEVHQYHASSSDLHADVRLVVNRATAPASGPITRLHYQAGGQRVAMRENGTLYYLLTDHLGSTSIAVNATGQVVSRVG